MLDFISQVSTRSFDEGMGTDTFPADHSAQAATAKDPAGRSHLWVDPEAWVDGVAVSAFDCGEVRSLEPLARSSREALLIRVQLEDTCSIDVHSGSNHRCSTALHRGQSILIAPDSDRRVRLQGPTRALHICFERRVLESMAHRCGADPKGVIERLDPNAYRPLDDDVVRNLGFSLLSALDSRDRATALFRGHIARAIASHTLETYGQLAAERCFSKGGLAPWQIRRAKSSLLSNLQHPPTLETVAEECGLSVSHFSRGFRRSVGTSPHAWLNAQRIERAKELMADATVPLAIVALECGFADQSHFTRTFSKQAKTSPGSWRRGLHRQDGVETGENRVKVSAPSAEREHALCLAG